MLVRLMQRLTSEIKFYTTSLQTSIQILDTEKESLEESVSKLEKFILKKFSVLKK